MKGIMEASNDTHPTSVLISSSSSEASFGLKSTAASSKTAVRSKAARRSTASETTTESRTGLVTLPFVGAIFRMVILPRALEACSSIATAETSTRAFLLVRALSSEMASLSTISAVQIGRRCST